MYLLWHLLLLLVLLLYPPFALSEISSFCKLIITLWCYSREQRGRNSIEMKEIIFICTSIMTGAMFVLTQTMTLNMHTIHNCSSVFDIDWWLKACIYIAPSFSSSSPSMHRCRRHAPLLGYSSEHRREQRARHPY